MPEISSILPNAYYVERKGEISAWDSPEFRNAISKINRKKLIMSGIVTEVCLMFPAIAAVKDNYDVYAVIDTSGTWNSTTQLASMFRMTQAGIKVSTFVSVLAEVMNDWRSPKGIELGSILSNYTSYNLNKSLYLNCSTRNK